MSGLDLGQMIAHGFAKLTGAQRDAGADRPVAATESGGIVLPDGTEMMRAKSGSIGLGVTPSAWSLGRAVEVGQVGNALFGYLTETHATNNCYYDSASGGWTFAYNGGAGRYMQQAGAHIWYIAPSGTTGNPISFIEVMKLDAGGNLVVTGGGSIGFSNNTGARAGSSGQYIIAADSGGLYQQAGGSYYLVTTAGGSTSDASLKTNVTPLARALERVEAIRGVNFEFIEQPLCAADQGIQLGVIAQEVEAQFPEIVLTGKDGTKTVRYDRLVAPLIEAVKELSAQNGALMARVAALEAAQAV